MNNSETIRKCITSVIKNENFVECEIRTPEQTGKSGGYMSSVVFVTVFGTKKDGQKKTLNYVAKTSSSLQSLRATVPLDQIFRAEICFYKKTLPILKNFQNEVGVEKNLLNFLPHCCFTSETVHQEIVILENVKSLGFNTWDKSKQLPHEYMKVILENFGKLHAFSFALKSKRPKIFEILKKEIKYGWREWISTLKMSDAMSKFLEEFRNNCKDGKEILDNMKSTKSDVKYAVTDLILEDPEDHVITHGDCWIHNFMFKTENTNEISACFLDWQLSSLASPVLSYFIYTCVDTGKYQDVDELLQIYYESLNNTLKQLGCDASELFPYNRLIYHWKKFSAFGIFLAGCFTLKFVCADDEEAPNLEEVIMVGGDISEFFAFSLQKNKELCYKKAKHNFLHYVRNLN